MFCKPSMPHFALLFLRSIWQLHVSGRSDEHRDAPTCCLDYCTLLINSSAVLDGRLEGMAFATPTYSGAMPRHWYCTSDIKKKIGWTRERISAFSATLMVCVHYEGSIKHADYCSLHLLRPQRIVVRIRVRTNSMSRSILSRKAKRYTQRQCVTAPLHVPDTDR